MNGRTGAFLVMLASLSCPRSQAVRPGDGGVTAPAEGTSSGPPSAPSAPSSRDGAASVRGPWLELYYPGWAIATSPPETIDWTGVTDVVLFGVVPSIAGDLDASTSAYTTQKLARAVVAARAAGASVLIAVGGEKTARRFRAALESDAGAEGLATSVGRFVEAHGVDGVVLDIEPLAELGPRPLEAFVRAVRARSLASAKPWRVEAVVAPDRSEIAHLAPVFDAFDRIAVMSYLGAPSADVERGLVAQISGGGVAPSRIGLGVDARTGTEERRSRVTLVRSGAAGGLIVWHAGTTCLPRDPGGPCRPSPSRLDLMP
jgi:hypothetical protein